MSETLAPGQFTVKPGDELICKNCHQAFRWNLSRADAEMEDARGRARVLWLVMIVLCLLFFLLALLTFVGSWPVAVILGVVGMLLGQRANHYGTISNTPLQVTCPTCNSADLLPADSPAAKKLMSES